LPCGTPFSLPFFTSYCASLGPLFDLDVVCTTLTFSFGCGGGFVCLTGGGVDLGGGVGGGGVGVGGGGVGTMTLTFLLSETFSTSGFSACVGL